MQEENTKKESLAFPESVAKPSGNVFDHESDCTLPLTRDISLKRVDGRYTEIDRKFWVILVHLAFENLGKKKIHQTNLRDIATLFREIGSGTDGTQWLIESANRLGKSSIQWDDSEEVGTSTLLASLKINKATGNVFYDFGYELTHKILDNKQFSRLRIHFMLGLSGKYAVSLYILLEGLANLRQPSITIPLEELRDRLNVPQGKLTDWRDFKKKALDPAIEQINNSEESGLVTTYHTETKGRKIVAIRFDVVKTLERNTKDKQSSRNLGNLQAKKTTAEIPPFSSSNYETFKQISGRLDVYAQEEEWRNWCAKTGKPTANPVGSFIVWLQKRVVAENKG